MRIFEKAGIFFISLMMLIGLFIHNPTRGYFNKNIVDSTQYVKNHSKILNDIRLKKSIQSLKEIQSRTSFSSSLLYIFESKENIALSDIEKEVSKENPNNNVLGLSALDFNEFIKIRNIPFMQWRSKGAVVKAIAYMGNFLLYEGLCLVLLSMWCFLFVFKRKPSQLHLANQTKP